MSLSREGSFRLGRFAGIDVFVHWSWFLIAIFSIQNRAGTYTAFIWNVYEYLGLFGIVLLHEFGHALACKQVGGTAREILLWPLGGIAFVSPPHRPGAHLWSIAAGPLVNAILVPVFYFAEQWAESSALFADAPNFVTLIWWLNRINIALLVFNMLPVYPLDGGQILRSLLWFWLGPAKSLFVASLIGFVGVAGLVALAIWWESIWTGIMAFFVYLKCKAGWQHAQYMTKLAAIPKHSGFACPDCGEHPPQGDLWICQQCQATFDTFLSNARCPNCSTPFPSTQCLHCGQSHPIAEWAACPSGTARN